MPADPRRGVLFGAAAYLIWGTFPLYFRLLEQSGALEIVAHRILWSLLVCGVLLGVGRGWSVVLGAIRDPRQLAVPTAAAFVLALNWGVYIYGVNSGQVVETSLGYFINPLVTVLLGVVVLRERLRPLQWTAVGIGTLAVVVLAVDYGRPPWIALTLAVSFGMYGLAKNRVGRRVGAVPSLTIETMALAPIAVAGLVWMSLTGTSTFAVDAPRQGLLLASAGVVTVIPLLCFAAAASRVPLTTLGLLQYLAPVLQLLFGVALLGETMPASRWAGFAIVWAALAVLSVDSIRQASAGRRHRRVEREGTAVQPGLQGTVPTAVPEPDGDPVSR
jgi:chloramphenicol-sensitive protein RarD